MTSNLGTRSMRDLLNPGWGFQSAVSDSQSSPRGKNLEDKLSQIGIRAVRRKFTPEFINRLDGIVVFRPLGDEELRKILGIELNAVRQIIYTSRLRSEQFFSFHLDQPAEDFLLKRGTDPTSGARHLKRAIDNFLVRPLSNLTASSQITGGDYISVGFDSALEKLTFSKGFQSAAPKVVKRRQNKQASPNMVEGAALAAGGGHD